MRATEFIRNLLDLIDSVDEKPQSADYEEETGQQEPEESDTQYSNSPDESYTDEKVIFSIGNDLNKPKHPSDLRSDSFSMYPNTQYDPRK